MSCPKCEKVELSHKEKPFVPPDGYEPNVTYVCPICGQRWWCYNDYYCLWSKINDDLSWENVRNGCPLPVAIGNPSAIVPGYEKYAIKPQSPISENRIPWPKVLLQGVLITDKEPSVVVQWTGDYECGIGNIFSYQFTFPILCLPKQIRFSPESFHVSFLGQIRRWSNERVREQAIETFKDPEKCIAHLVSAKFEEIHSSGPGPVSFIAEVVLLGDGTVGIIRPHTYDEPYIFADVVEQFEKEQAKRVVQNA